VFLGFRFQRRFKVLPGLRLNASKSGVSTSVGTKGAWFTFGPRGTRSTVGLPGTGLSYTGEQRTGRLSRGGSCGAVFLGIILVLLVLALFVR
jgi:hypothetical protein